MSIDRYLTGLEPRELLRSPVAVPTDFVGVNAGINEFGDAIAGGALISVTEDRYTGRLTASRSDGVQCLTP